MLFGIVNVEKWKWKAPPGKTGFLLFEEFDYACSLEATTQGQQNVGIMVR
jgi:hypothetical protein